MYKITINYCFKHGRMTFIKKEKEGSLVVKETSIFQWQSISVVCETLGSTPELQTNKNIFFMSTNCILFST